MVRLLVATAVALASAAAVAGDLTHFFTERHWSAVREFYNEQMRAGTCPIGFARKEGGCEPPRLARKWAVGKPIPPGTIRFDLPHALVEKLGKPPAGHRYLRVGPDLLLVSNRSKLVIDAIQDLGRR
jgi:Ni/Co efflux regulator RcnB